MILSTLLLASPILIQEPEQPIPLTHKGEDALAAYDAWTQGLPTELDYPVQMFIGFEIAMDMPSTGMDMEMSMQLHSLSDSAEELRLWGNFRAYGTDSIEDFEWDAHFEAGVNDAGLRMTFEDDGVLAKEMGMEIPSGFTLSADRLGKISEMYFIVFEAMPSIYGPEMMEALQSITGPGQMMHPALWTRYISYTPGWDIIGWGERDGIARVEIRLDVAEMTKSLEGEELPFDLNNLDGMIQNMTLSLSTGAILDWNMEMDIPMDLDPGQDGAVGHMSMEMEMRTVPVSANAPSIVMPSEGVMDLNPHFDEALPIIEMVMEMMAEEVKKQQGEKESSDDFEF